jgi:hypothetical protein
MRGEVRSIGRYKQLLDFSGLNFERNITPTDIDMFLDLGAAEFVITEYKLDGHSTPTGQRRALTELLKALSGSGIALGVVAVHSSPAHQMIDAARCIVVEYWSGGQWRTLGRKVTVRELIDRWRDNNRASGKLGSGKPR